MLRLPGDRRDLVSLDRRVRELRDGDDDRDEQGRRRRQTEPQRDRPAIIERDSGTVYARGLARRDCRAREVEPVRFDRRGAAVEP